MKKNYTKKLIGILALAFSFSIACLEANAQYPFWKWIGGLSTTNNTGTYPTAVGLSDNNAYPAARIGGTAQYLNGKLYIFGGHNSTSNRFADIWSYDIAVQTWTLLNAASNTYANTTDPDYGVSKTPNSSTRPGGRSGVNSVLVGNDIYIFGGQGYTNDGANLGSGKLGDLWKFSTISNTWALLRGVLTNGNTATIGTKGDTNDDGTFRPRSRSNGCLAAVGTNIYLYGGESSGVTGDLWKWDTTTSKWLWLTGNDGATALVNNGVDDAANTPSARQGAAFVAIGTKIYLFGGTTSGNTETNMKNDLWVYDTISGFWNLITPDNTAPAIRKDVQGWTYDGKLYIFGGVSRADINTSKVTNDLWEYDPATNKWTMLKGADTATGSYVDGDYNSSTTPPQVTNTTTPTGRVGILAASDGSKLYLFGGDRTTGWSQRYNDLWVMDLTEHNLQVLPVNFISFNAKADGNRAKLTWSTASEKDNAYFEIEKSTDGSNFSLLTKVNANGNTTSTSNYLAYDNNPAQTTYYRLAQVDNDGVRTTLGSAVVSFKLDNAVKVSTYPNPATTQVSLSIASYIGKVLVTVKDVNGKSLKQYAGSANQGQALLLDVSDLASGLYFFEVSGDNFKQTEKVIVK